MTEKVKKHTHHTPQVYLRRFATDDGMLMTQRPKEHGEKSIPVPEVGVRKRFYTVELPDGTKSNAAEDSLGRIENQVGHAFGALDAEALPLPVATKTVLAEFLGHQMSRGIGYREMRSAKIAQDDSWIRERVRDLVREHAPTKLRNPPGDVEALAEEYARDYDVQALMSQNTVVEGAMHSGLVLTNALVNMCWTFMRFENAALLSSDQPVVCWLGPHMSSPWGAQSAVEMRVPLSPTLALVATWHDQSDSPAFVRGRAIDAMSINHHTAKQAADWIYWRPGTSPRRSLPLYEAPILGPRLAHSRRRDLTTRLVTDRIIEGGEQVVAALIPEDDQTID